MPTDNVKYTETLWDPTNGDKVVVGYVTTPGYEVEVGISSCIQDITELTAYHGVC